MFQLDSYDVSLKFKNMKVGYETKNDKIELGVPFWTPVETS